MDVTNPPYDAVKTGSKRVLLELLVLHKVKVPLNAGGGDDGAVVDDSGGGDVVDLDAAVAELEEQEKA